LLVYLSFVEYTYYRFTKDNNELQKHDENQEMKELFSQDQLDYKFQMNDQRTFTQKYLRSIIASLLLATSFGAFVIVILVFFNYVNTGVAM